MSLAAYASETKRSYCFSEPGVNERNLIPNYDSQGAGWIRLPECFFASPLARLLFTMSPTWRACSHAKLFPIYRSISSSSSRGPSQLQCTTRDFAPSSLNPSSTPFPPHLKKENPFHLYWQSLHQSLNKLRNISRKVTFSYFK